MSGTAAQADYHSLSPLAAGIRAHAGGHNKGAPLGARTAAGSSVAGAVVSQMVTLVAGPLALAGALTTATGRQSVWSRLDAPEPAVGAGAKPEASGAGACATMAVGSTIARATAEARDAVAGLPHNRQGLSTINQQA